MSVRSDITRAMEWFWGERKTLTIVVRDVNGNAVNLSTTNMSWKVRKEQGSGTVWINKALDGTDTSGNTNEIVAITIDPDTDYNTMPAGIHWHQLRDEDNDAELSYGDAHVRLSRGGD